MTALNRISPLTPGSSRCGDKRYTAKAPEKSDQTKKDKKRTKKEMNYYILSSTNMPMIIFKGKSVLLPECGEENID